MVSPMTRASKLQKRGWPQNDTGQHAQNQLSCLQLHASKQQPGQQPGLGAGHPTSSLNPSLSSLAAAAVPSLAFLSFSTRAVPGSKLSSANLNG